MSNDLVPKPRSRKAKNLALPTRRKEATYVAEMAVAVRLRGKAESLKDLQEILEGIVKRGSNRVTTVDGAVLEIIRR